jgi:hypothetical protein
MSFLSDIYQTSLHVESMAFFFVDVNDTENLRFGPPYVIQFKEINVFVNKERKTFFCT